MMIPIQYFMATTATYTVLIAFSLMLNVLTFWLITAVLAFITNYFAKKFGTRNLKKEEITAYLDENYVLGDVSLRESLHQPDNSADNQHLIVEYYETVNNLKNKPLRYISSAFSWISWIFFASIPTCYGAFNLIPVWLSIILSFIILNMRFWISIYQNCPISITKGRSILKVYRQVVNTMFRMHKKMAIFGFVCVTGVTLLINMGTYKSCINDHVAASYGITLNSGGSPFLYSSALIRFFTIDKVCPPGPPCHVYATVPFDTSSSVFFNVHTNVEYSNITLNYDTKENYELHGALGLQAFTSYMISPYEYDMKGERNIHTVLLTGLEPDQTYMIEIYYNGAMQYNSTYQTLPGVNSTSSYNLIYGGDLGVSDATLSVSKMIATQDPRLLMIGGDLSYDNGEAYCYYNLDLTLFMIEQNIFAKLGRIVPLTLTVGNHDVGFDSLAEVNVPINENGPSFYLGFPQHYPIDNNGNVEVRVPEVTERITYHSHMIGNILNVVLDPGYMTPYDGDQLYWLRNVSHNYSNYVKVAIYHDPIISACQSSYSAQSTNDGLTYWIPTFDNYNYMAVFEHHTHTFKRSFPLRGLVPSENGTIYFGEGDWGVYPSECDFDNSTGFFEAYASVNHIWVVNVNQAENSIKYSALVQNGSLIEAPISQDMNIYSGPLKDEDL